MFWTTQVHDKHVADKQFSGIRSDNPKSKIANQNWVMLALVLAFACLAAWLESQQPKKVPSDRLSIECRSSS